MKTRVLNLGFSLLLTIGMSACNKSEFFEKEFLETPTSGTTEGSVNGGQAGTDGGDGNTQGGVDSGVDGGTAGGSTTGSSTGGVDGSTTGGTDGSTVGGTQTGGATIGGVDGSTTSGSSTGSSVGGVDGSTTSGSTVGGSSTGGVTGSTIGGTTGGSTGSTTAGSTTGSTVGGVDGSTIGGTTGSSTGGTSGSSTGGVVYVPASETFHQSAEETKKLDIVWIIDNSGSMSDEQTALGSNFSAFINEFIDKNVDFKMAITTTDTSSSSKKGAMVYGSDTKLTSAKAQANPTQFKKDFQNLVKVGTSGSGSEQGLAASEGFMQKYSSSWVRSDAYLAVVVISDEEDQSSKSVASYTNYLKSFKGTEGLVKVYSVVDVNNTNCCQNGIATGSERYKEASNKTAGLIADIRDDFHNVLTDMGDSIINLLDSFALAGKPVAGSLKVYVNGVLATNYTYDDATHSIKFHQNSLPPVGAEIKVTYLK